MTRMTTTALAALALLAAPAWAEQHTGSSDASGSGGEGAASEAVTMAARAAVMDADGNEIGTVTVNRTASGTPLVIVALTDLPEGSHAIHLHETGDCEGDGFQSAGGHIAGDAEHGVGAQGGPHPGDLPNVVVDSTGAINAEFFNERLDIDGMVLDGDGSAFIVHAGQDDYVSQPAGDAGDRIACGVLEGV